VRVVVSAHNVVNYPEGGGHFWVYLQYVQGLRSIGCDVWWMEEFRPTGDAQRDNARVRSFATRLDRYGLGSQFLLYTGDGEHLEYAGTPEACANAVFRDTDLLLNFHQAIPPCILEKFRRTALVDIDPGLLQYWMSAGVLSVAPHHLYFTTGETVGTARATFPDCGINWIQIRPPVSLDFWPYVPEPIYNTFTTVSSWWGVDQWVEYGGEIYDNNKRASFLKFADLPRLTVQPLELALFFGTKDQEELDFMGQKGWSIRHSHEVAATPEQYQSYIQRSRGEFSCAKASCMKFQNAWVSDRTLCYLASGRPVVVQDTGPSAILPNGLGMFRFSTLEEAAAALDTIASNYAVHSRAARDIAEGFDAPRVAEKILSCCT
jgi:hypothetical protein